MLTILALLLAVANAVPAGDKPGRRRLLAWGTTYCYPESLIPGDSLTIGCASSVPTTAPPCAVGWKPTEESPVCALGTSTFGAEEGQGASYKLDYCPDRVVYEADGSQYWFCSRLESTGDWSTRVRPSDQPDSAYTDSWWPETSCWFDPWWSWVDGRCMSNTRYLHERCWDGGECNNEGIEQYDGLHLSCAPPSASLGITEPTCVPSAKLLDVERDQCECGWFDWYVGFACGAADGSCNGHACVLTTQDLNYYCDYQTDNDW